MSDIAELITGPLFIKKCVLMLELFTRADGRQPAVHDMGHMVSEVSQPIASSSYKGKAS